MKEAEARIAELERERGSKRTPFCRYFVALFISALLVTASTVTDSWARSYGTLVTDPAHISAEAQAGIQDAMLELNWGQYEPQSGVFNASYIASVRSTLQAFLNQGDRVTLGLGIHNPPAWVFGLRNARFVDQYGHTSSESNVVFSQAVRDAVSVYLKHVGSDLGWENISAVRLTSGGDAEMLYPPSAAAPAAPQSYWAYDPGAQGGPGLAAGLTPAPLRGWKPGQTAGYTTRQVQTWARWYVGALDNVTAWFQTQLATDGYRGQYQLLTPGSGTRPGAWRNAITGYLADPYDYTTPVGAVWAVYYARLSDRTNTIAYVSSVADNSGNPTNNACATSDDRVALSDPTAASWSATRWISRLADQYGMAKAGENPNWASADDALLSYYNDDTGGTGMMATAFNQLSSCQFQSFYWAHDKDLWGGDKSTLALSDYASYIGSNSARRAPGPSGSR